MTKARKVAEVPRDGWVRLFADHGLEAEQARGFDVDAVTGEFSFEFDRKLARDISLLMELGTQMYFSDAFLDYLIRARVTGLSECVLVPHFTPHRVNGRPFYRVWIDPWTVRAMTGQVGPIQKVENVVKFFSISIDMGRRISGRWTLGYIEDEAGDAIPLSYAIPFKGTEVKGNVFSGSEPTDYSEAGHHVPVVRAQLAKAVAAAAGGDVEFIQFVLEDFPGFVVLNVVRVVDCLDVERSGLKPMSSEDLAESTVPGNDPSKYRYGTEGTDIYIDGSRVPEDVHIFRPFGFEPRLIVSELVKIVMEDTGCIGAKFRQAGERLGDVSATPAPRKPAKKRTR